MPEPPEIHGGGMPQIGETPGVVGAIAGGVAHAETEQLFEGPQPGPDGGPKGDDMFEGGFREAHGALAPITAAILDGP